MNENVYVRYKGYDIVVSIAICRKGTYDIIAEYFTMHEAKKDYNVNLFDFWYLAAEIIDKDGNVNPACWGKTRKEAVDKLKSVL